MIESRFVILGIENSGKSSYLKNMSNFLANDTSFSLVNDKQYSNSQYEYIQNEFFLRYENNNIMKISISDYSGALLKSRDDSVDCSVIKNDINSSDYIIIFINGDFFTDNNKFDCIKNIKKKCTRTLNPYLAECAEKNQDNLPPVFFAVTKSDLILQSYSNQDIFDCINEAFNSIFSDESKPYIMRITNQDINAAQIPIMIGIYHMISCECENIKKETEKSNSHIQDRINDNNTFLKSQNDRLILKNPLKIKKVESENTQLRILLQNNKSTLNTNPIWQQKKMFNTKLTELVKNNANSLVYGFDSELNYSGNISNANINSIFIKALVLIILFILAQVVPSLAVITSLGATFIYAKKHSFIMAVLTIFPILTIGDMWIAILLQIIIIVLFVRKKLKK